MSKKKNKQNPKTPKVKKVKDHKKKKPQSSSIEAVVISKELINTVEKLKNTTSTFSKKLEEIISEKEENEEGRILLLSAPKKLGFRSLAKRTARLIKNFALMFLILCFLATLFISLELYSDGKVFPRVKFGPIGLSFQSQDIAQQKIKTALEEWLSKKQQIVYQDKTIELLPSEMTWKINIDKTLAALPIFELHRNYFWDLFPSSLQETNILPVFSIDADTLEYNLTKGFELDSLAPHNAAFYRDEKKQIKIRAEKEGQKINLLKLLTDLNNNLETLQNVPIQIELESNTPDITTADMEAIKDSLLLKLETPLVLRSGTSSWKIVLADHLNLIDYYKKEGQIYIELDKQYLREYLQPEVLSKIEREKSNIKIYYNDKQEIVFEGDAVDGVSVKKDELFNLLEMAIEGLLPEVEVPTEITKAQVESDDRLKEMGIQELIGVGHSAFAGSPPNRRFNIGVGMKKLNGTLVPKGETFSFTTNLGPVEGYTGYKLELVIKAEGTVPEYGGGICQVSSTFFKAALLTGLPIVERSPHSYSVSYYAQIDGYGLDATIYPGVKDLQFTNDTPAAILIQTIIDGNNAYVKIYGTSDGRTVTMKDYWRGNFRGAGGTQLIPTTTLPTGTKKQIESAHGGFDASWNRIIKFADGAETKENIYSVYRATANKILVGE